MDKNIKDAGDEEIIAWLKECRKTASLGGGIIQFARADEKDWQEIKQLSNEELKRSYIESSLMNMESVSLRDAQITNMMCFELDLRGIDITECNAEIEKGYKEFEEEQKDCQEIEQLSNEELKKSYINSSLMNDVSASVRDIELRDMMSYELKRRGLITECDAEIAKINKENEKKAK